MTDVISLDDNGVEHVVHRRDGRRFFHHARIHVQRHALVARPADAQQFDSVSQFFGIGDVHRIDATDALNAHLLQIHRHPERQTAQNAHFVRGVQPVHVQRRIGLFGVSEFLRFRQHVLERASRFAHHRQNVIASAVQNAVNLGHCVAGEALAQRLDNRDAARDGGFIAEENALFLRQRAQFVAVMRQHRLVRRDEVFGFFKRGAAEIKRETVRSADQFDENVGVLLFQHFHRVFIVNDARRQIQRGGARFVNVGDGDQFNLSVAPLGKQFLLFNQQFGNARTDNAQSGDSDFKTHDLDSFSF